MPDDNQHNYYKTWMWLVDKHKVRTKDYGSCLKTTDALTYLRLNGGENIVEVDAGIQFSAHGSVHVLVPIFQTGSGWLYPINAMNDLLFIHDGRL